MNGDGPLFHQKFEIVLLTCAVHMCDYLTNGVFDQIAHHRPSGQIAIASWMGLFVLFPVLLLLSEGPLDVTCSLCEEKAEATTFDFIMARESPSTHAPEVFALGEDRYAFTVLVPLSRRARRTAVRVLIKYARPYIREARNLDGEWEAAAKVHVEVLAEASEHHMKNGEAYLTRCPALVICDTREGLKSNALQEVPRPPTAPDLAVYAACVSVPLFGSFSWPWVLTFMDYYEAQGLDRLYMHTLSGAPPAWVTQSIKERKLEVTFVDASDIPGLECSWYYSQELLLQNCNMRAAEAGADWVLHLDLDEFLVLPDEEPPFLPKAIEMGGKMGGEGVQGVTFGSLKYDVSRCTGAAPRPPRESSYNATIAESFVLVDPKPVCGRKPHPKGPPSNFCRKDKGHRKYLVNPRTVWFLGIHHAMPLLSSASGHSRYKYKDLDARRAVMHHYRGALAKPLCTARSTDTN